MRYFCLFLGILCPQEFLFLFLIEFFTASVYSILPEMDSVEEAPVDGQLPDDFLRMLHLSEADLPGDEDWKIDNSASIKNPNKNDPRRLFQIYQPHFFWDPNIDYDDQPNRLNESGPMPLLFPDHFLEVQGGISAIY